MPHTLGQLFPNLKKRKSDEQENGGGLPAGPIAEAVERNRLALYPFGAGAGQEEEKNIPKRRKTK